MIRVPHALIIGCVLIAAALYFGGNTQAISQNNGPRGPYMIARGDDNYAWRIDQATGMVSFCIRDTQSTDRKFIKQRGPYCSAWGN